MQKYFLLLAFSVLLLVPVVVQSAYAGFSCQLEPLEVTLTLEKGESSVPIPKMIDCSNSNNPISAVGINHDDCTSKGIDYEFDNQIFGLSSWQIDETFTNTGGFPGKTHCEVTFEVAVPFEPNVFLVQQIWIATPEPPVVGGEFLSVDSTALLLANAQSFTWMIPVVLSVLGIGLFLFRKSE